jgi:hypothetical protein
MRVRQHIPSFFEGFEPRRTYVFNTEDLEGLEFIRHWSEEQMFHRFAVHRHYFHRHGHGEDEDVHLMLAEFDGGKQWWVIAYLEGDDSLEILAKYPEWEVKS